jgi:hypothetical protein
VHSCSLHCFIGCSLFGFKFEFKFQVQTQKQLFVLSPFSPFGPAQPATSSLSLSSFSPWQPGPRPSLFLSFPARAAHSPVPAQFPARGPFPRSRPDPPVPRSFPAPYLWRAGPTCRTFLPRARPGLRSESGSPPRDLRSLRRIRLGPARLGALSRPHASSPPRCSRRPAQNPSTRAAIAARAPARRRAALPLLPTVDRPSPEHHVVVRKLPGRLSLSLPRSRARTSSPESPSRRSPSHLCHGQFRRPLLP